MGKKIISADNALDALLHVHEALGLPHLICILAIAAHPGLSVNELAKITGYPQQSVSRYTALLLGRYDNPTGPSLGKPLIEQSINSADPRRRAFHLTSPGQSFVDDFIARIARKGY